MVLTLKKLPFLLVVAVVLYGLANASQLEIQAFQPAVVPIRAITTLTLKTNMELNVTSNSSLQCRFKDISVPARKEDGFIYCDTPPIRNTDRVSLYLDVDGKLFKTKKPLYFHEPFKVSNITPTVVSPAQNIHLTVSGISCKDWMQYFVRFQTANGTKKTQQGICKDAVVTCSVPEFPPNTILRVGLTLSNRLVEWAGKKILIQYPIDAMQSRVKDVKTDITNKGAFTFSVMVKDRYKNSIRVIDKDNKTQAKISVQYTSQDFPQSMKFLDCSKTLKIGGPGDQYELRCAGADNERIHFYPSINNVPLGGQAKYEARTTLCPGKSSCEVTEKSKSSPLAIILGCVGGALFLLMVAVILDQYIRRRHSETYKLEKRRREKGLIKTELEMKEEHHEAATEEITGSSEGATGTTPTGGNTGETNLGACGTDEGCERGHKADEDCPQGHQAGVETARVELQEGEKDDQSDEGIEVDTVNMRSILNDVFEIEMASLKVEEDGIATLLTRLQSSADRLSSVIEAGKDDKRDQQENQENEPQKQPLILIKQMQGDIQEIEELCKEREEETATKKTKATLQALRLAVDDPSRAGRCSVLALIEELHENMADLGTVAVN